MSIGVGAQGSQFSEQFIRDMAKKDVDEFEKSRPSAKRQDKVKQGFKDGTPIGAAKGNNISQNNEAKLSEKAQKFLKNLREKYGDYDFMVGNSSDDLKSLSKGGSKEFSVIFSSAEIERMANDEEYAEEKMKSVEGAVNMSKRICEENGFLRLGENGENGTINKISITVGDDGSMKIFAELQKTSDKQKERIEKAREDRRAEEKKAQQKADKKNPYEKDDKASVKRTTIEAASEEEFIKKLKELNWNDVPEAYSGDRFNFKA